MSISGTDRTNSSCRLSLCGPSKLGQDLPQYRHSKRRRLFAGHLCLCENRRPHHQTQRSRPALGRHLPVQRSDHASKGDKVAVPCAGAQYAPDRAERPGAARALARTGLFGATFAGPSLESITPGASRTMPPGAIRSTSPASSAARVPPVRARAGPMDGTLEAEGSDRKTNLPSGSHKTIALPARSF